jgi:vacuolar-type H+-ATPase subunit E/Vma4
VRLFSPPPPPPADAPPVLEELVTLRVREKVQSDLRQDRQELLNTMERSMQGIANSLSDKIGGVEKNLNIKIDSTKTETSLQAAAYALAGATLAVSTLGFVFEKKVEVVDVKPAPT